MAGVRPLGARHKWLSITPEPELELPEALAALRTGGSPSAAQVELERARAERLVTRGSRRAWRQYLADALALAATSEDPAVAEARALVEDVVRNHNNLELAI
jgi:hypothetical protein